METAPEQLEALTCAFMKDVRQRITALESGQAAQADQLNGMKDPQLLLGNAIVDFRTSLQSLQACQVSLSSKVTALQMQHSAFENELVQVSELKAEQDHLAEHVDGAHELAG